MILEPTIPNNEHPVHRLTFLDPIRVGLVILVILHHVSITYGGGGSWYYKEADAPQLTSLLLTVFTATNQSFFMGFFFLMAGYLMPRALANKGEAVYLGDRALRLGVPILLFGYFLAPLARALAVGARGGDFLGSLVTGIGNSSFDLGPLWFNQALLIGTLIWIFLPHLTSVFKWPRWSLAPHLSIAVAVVGCGLLAFSLRLAVPVGQNVLGMQIGYFASYLILFFGAAWGAQERLLERVTLRHALPWLLVSLLTFPVLWIYALRTGAFSTEVWRGGWNMAAGLYALWEPLVATGIIMTSLALVRRWYVVDRPWIMRLAKSSYATFVVHPPIAVACSWLVQDWAATHALRFFLAGPLSCILSFAIGGLLSRGFAKMLAHHSTSVPEQSHVCRSAR